MIILPLLYRILKDMFLDYKKILAFIFPPSPDELLIADISETEMLSLYTPRSGVHATTLLPYTNPKVKAAIHLAKFHNHARAKKLLARVLAKYISTHIQEDEALIIPVPLSAARKRARGYNQVEEIIKLALKETHPAPLMCTQLKRIRNTPAQTSLSRDQRLKNVLGAFLVTDTHRKLEGSHIVLIDDVVTTGATLQSAKKALQKAKPASITCVALAH